MLCAALLCTFILVATTFISLSQPWLGLRLAPDTMRDGLQIVTVAPSGPSAGLEAGSRLLSVAPAENPSGRIVLREDDIVEESDFFDTYERIDDFFHRQTSLHRMLTQGPVQLETISPGGQTTLHTITASSRPLSNLPLVYWVQICVGVVSMMVGAWVWSLRRGDIGAIMFALTGVCLLIAVMPAAIYSSRELALDGSSFSILSKINHVGTAFFGAAMTALFLCHPRQIVRPAWILAVFLLVAIFTAINVLRLAPNPQLGIQIPIFVEMTMVVGAVAWQWRANRNDLRNLAALRWLGLSVILGAGTFVCIIILPSFLGQGIVISQGYSFLFFLLIYLGIMLGLRRYRLFQLEDWAVNILFYAVGIVILVILDAALIYILSLGREMSFAISLLAVGFIYLPFRELVWRRVTSRRQMPQEDLFRHVMDVAFTGSASQRAMKWQELLRSIYDPLNLETIAETIDDAAIREDGIKLVIPPVAGAPALMVSHPWQGRALLAPSHLQLARQIISLMRHAEENRGAYEKGAVNERKRIAQDLHDDVGARLLSGLHKPDVAQTHEALRASLADIRTIVSGLTGERLPLEQVLSDLRYETSQRLDAAGIALDWPLSVAYGDETLLEYRIYKNLTSALREIISNVIRHASASRVAMSVMRHGDRLEIHIADDGAGMTAQAHGSQRGTGLHNIRRRVEEVGGSISMPASEKGTQFALSLPLKAIAP